MCQPALWLHPCSKNAASAAPPSPTHPPVCSRFPNKVTGVQDRIASLQTQTWLCVIKCLIIPWIKHLLIPFTRIKSTDWQNRASECRLNSRFYRQPSPGVQMRASDPNREGVRSATAAPLVSAGTHPESPYKDKRHQDTVGCHSCCPFRTCDSKMSQNQEFPHLHSDIKVEVLQRPKAKDFNLLNSLPLILTIVEDK